MPFISHIQHTCNILGHIYVKVLLCFAISVCVRTDNPNSIKLLQKIIHCAKLHVLIITRLSTRSNPLSYNIMDSDIELEDKIISALLLKEGINRKLLGTVRAKIMMPLKGEGGDGTDPRPNRKSYAYMQSLLKRAISLLISHSQCTHLLCECKHLLINRQQEKNANALSPRQDVP